MSLDSTHPNYANSQADWIQMRDLYKGQRAVKQKGTLYLPATKGMLLDGMGKGTRAGVVNIGQEAYDAYRTRASFPDYVKEAVESFVGLLHQKPPTIELPAVMEPLRERCTMYGEPLELLLRRINEEQLVTGRCGLLVDLPVTPDQSAPMPYIALYVGEAIRNWDDGEINEGESKLNLVILDESGFKRDAEFNWNPVTKYRVLMLGSTAPAPQQETDTVTTVDPTAAETYSVGVFVNDGNGAPEFVPSQMRPPVLRGKTLDAIPFVFVNTKDIVSIPDNPPLMGLGDLVLVIYRGEADYRQNLFLQGQDTFVITGDRKKPPEDQKDELRTGAGSLLELEQGGTAEYVGVNSSGLPEQRSALENDRKRAETKSGQLIDATSGDKESGAALNTRIGAQTATLNQIAWTGAAALEKALRYIATWLGANPDEVKVTPNTEFADFDMSGENLVKLMTARTMGAPLSMRSIHALMVDRGLTKLDFETEMDLVQEEDANNPRLKGTIEGGNPDDPNDPANPRNQPPKDNPEDGDE